MNFSQLIKRIIFGTPADSPIQNKQAQSSLDRELIRSRWHSVEELMRAGKPSNFKTAILEADKLLDYVLKGKGYPGQTMGERMKSIPRQDFDRTFFDTMWSAHKLRNELAHNFEYEVMDFEAKKAIEDFKATLVRMGIIL